MDGSEKQKYFNEITWHLLNDEKPSLYINSLSEHDVFKEYPFYLLALQKKTEQSVKYHQEGNVWNHTMMVVDEAARVRDKSKDPAAFMWAALLHDIGKPPTTRMRKGRITSYDHDKEGERLSVEFLNEFTGDNEFIKKAAALVRYHMHMLYILKDLPYADKAGLIGTGVNPDELALLCMCDRLGRTGADRHQVEQEYRKFLDKLYNMTGQKQIRQ